MGERPDVVKSGVMGHRVYTGEFAALESALIEEIRMVQGSDPLASAAVLVGSNLLASQLRFRVVEKRGAVANLKFYTFLDLAQTLASSRRDNCRPPLPALGPSLILDRVLRESTPPGYSRISELRGFREAMLSTLRDLRDAAVRPAELREYAEATASSAPDRAAQLRDLAGVFTMFRAGAGLFLDVDDEFLSAVAAAEDAATTLGTGRLFVYGIYDATGRQAELLHRLSRFMELFYFIPFVDDDSSGFVRPFLESRLAELGVCAEHLSPSRAASGLRVLADRLFSGRTGLGPLPPDGSFRLISVPGESRAAVEVAREVLQSVRDGLVGGFHEIALLLRHKEEDAGIFVEALRLRNIPFFLHGGTSFGGRPLSRAVLAIAALEQDAYSQQAVQRTFELIESALPPDTTVRCRAAEWRLLIRGLGPVSGPEMWSRKLNELLQEADRSLRRARAAEESGSEPAGGEKATPSVSQATRRLESVKELRSTWERLRQAASGWPESLSWRDWAGLVESRLLPLIGEAPDWEGFSTVLDGLSSLDRISESLEPGRTVGRREMTAALEELLSRLTIPEGRFQRTGVNLLSLADARGLRFPVVIVPGLDEGRFPARLRQDPLLLDEDRRSLGSPPQLPLKSLRVEEEKLLFSMAVRSAEKRVVLVTSRLEEASDRERIPSDFFLRAASAVCGAHISLRDLSMRNVPGLRSVSLDRPVPGPGADPVDEGEVRLALIFSSPAPGRALRALAEVEPERLAGPIAFDQARWHRGLTRFDGRIEEEELVLWVAGRFGPAAGKASPGRMELYASCPYRFFLNRVMGLEAWEDAEPATGLDPLRRGLVLHRILESFLRRNSWEEILAPAAGPVRSRLRSDALEMLEEAKPAGIPDLLWEIERDRLLALLGQWLDFERSRAASGLRPRHLELSFGDGTVGEGPGAFVIKAGRHRFEFRGRIDRLDMTEDESEARIIDYKTGKLPDTLEKGTALMDGERMQLVIYAAALSAAHPNTRFSGEYLHLQPRDLEIRPRSFSPEELRAALRRLPFLLEIMGDGIDQGVFFDRARGSVYPGGSCRICDFTPVCGKDRQRRQLRKISDPLVRRFEQLKDAGEQLEEHP